MIANPLEFGISITPDWSKQDEVLASRTGEELTGVARTGMDAFIFWPGGDDPVGQVEMFASDVAPLVRAEVAGS